MKIKIPFIGYMWAVGGLLQAQTPVEQRGFFPPLLEENSGLIATASDRFWTMNDGDNPTQLYQVDDRGALLRTVFVSDAQNVDWEDLAYDRAGGYFFVGDMGNNKNDRRDLTIYRIPNPEGLPDSDTVRAQTIRFTYPEQEAFPPDKSDLNYDAEALVFFRGHLYIFTKCRTRPYNSRTRLYRLPAEPGEYRAELLDSFDTGQASWYSSVTGADISPDGKRLALISGDRIWLFSDFSGDQFFRGKVQTLETPNFTQKEAIAFADNGTLFFGDERSILGRARLYRLELEPAGSLSPSQRFLDVRIDPMPLKTEASVSFRTEQPLDVQLWLYDEDRRPLRRLQNGYLQAGSHTWDFDVKTWKIERYTNYYLVFQTNGAQHEWHPVVVK